MLSNSFQAPRTTQADCRYPLLTFVVRSKAHFQVAPKCLSLIVEFEDSNIGVGQVNIILLDWQPYICRWL